MNCLSYTSNTAAQLRMLPTYIILIIYFYVTIVQYYCKFTSGPIAGMSKIYYPSVKIS